MPPPLGIPGTWSLVLNSDFGASKKLDTMIWTPGWFGVGFTGPINPGTEDACYNSSNVMLPGDGTVHLRVVATPSRCHSNHERFSGAVLSSNPKDGRKYGGFQYRYGVLEARIYIPPYGSEIADWPAIITLGQDWPKDGEDDVLEGIGGTDCYRFHSLLNIVVGFGGCLYRVHPGWHTVAANWERGSVTYYYDGVEVSRVTKGITNSPMYIVVVNTVSQKYPEVWRSDAVKIAFVRVWQTSPYGLKTQTGLTSDAAGAN